MAVYMDFMKAFNTVPHKHLLPRLLHYGINGNIWNWVRDFLIGRTQRVVVNWKPIILAASYQWDISRIGTGL